MLGVRQSAVSASRLARRSLATLPPTSHVPPKYEGPSYDEVLKNRKEYGHPVRSLAATR